MQVISGIASPADTGSVDIDTIVPVIPATGALAEFYSELAVPLTGSKLVRHRNAYAQLRTSGLWDKADWIAGGMMSEADALLNWKLEGFGGDPRGINTGATWSEANQFSFDGVNDVLAVGYLANGAGAKKYQLNSASFGVYVTTPGAGNNPFLGSAPGSTDSVRAALWNTGGAGGPAVRMNSGTTTVGANVANRSGLFMLDRPDGATQKLYHRGVEIVSEAVAASALPGGNLVIGRNQSTFASGGAGAWIVGPHFTPDDHVLFSQIFDEFFAP